MKVNSNISTNTYQKESKKANLNVNKTSDFVIPTKTEKSPIDFTIKEYKNMTYQDIDTLYSNNETYKNQAIQLWKIATVNGDKEFKQDTFDLIKEDFKNNPKLESSGIFDGLFTFSILQFEDIVKESGDKIFKLYYENTGNQKISYDINDTEKTSPKKDFYLDYDNVLKMYDKLKEYIKSWTMEGQLLYKENKIDEKINSYLERYQEKAKEKKHIIKQF